MGDGVSITSGGAIEVDSAAFREVGQRLALLAGEVGGSADVVRDAAHMLSATRGSSLPVQPADLHAHAARLQHLHHERGSGTRQPGDDGCEAGCRRHSRTRLRSRKSRLAGRSPSLRIKYGYQASPKGT